MKAGFPNKVTNLEAESFINDLIAKQDVNSLLADMDNASQARREFLEHTNRLNSSVQRHKAILDNMSSWTNFVTNACAQAQHTKLGLPAAANLEGPIPPQSVVMAELAKKISTAASLQAPSLDDANEHLQMDDEPEYDVSTYDECEFDVDPEPLTQEQNEHEGDGFVTPTPIETSGSSPNNDRLPGHWFMRLAGVFAHSQTIELQYEPKEADIHNEYFTALSNGQVWRARRIRVSGPLSLWWLVLRAPVDQLLTYVERFRSLS